MLSPLLGVGDQRFRRGLATVHLRAPGASSRHLLSLRSPSRLQSCTARRTRGPRSTLRTTSRRFSTSKGATSGTPYTVAIIVRLPSAAEAGSRRVGPKGTSPRLKERHLSITLAGFCVCSAPSAPTRLRVHGLWHGASRPIHDHPTPKPLAWLTPSDRNPGSHQRKQVKAPAAALTPCLRLRQRLRGARPLPRRLAASPRRVPAAT